MRRSLESKEHEWEKLNQLLKTENATIATTETTQIEKDNKTLTVPQGTALPYSQKIEEQIDQYIIVPVQNEEIRTPDEHGFLYSFNQGDEIELKYDPQPELERYPEWPPHTHNSLETYYIKGEAGLVTPKNGQINGIDEIEDYNGFEEYRKNHPKDFQIEHIINNAVTIPPKVPHSVEYIHPDTEFLIHRETTDETQKMTKESITGEIIYEIQK